MRDFKGMKRQRGRNRGGGGGGGGKPQQNANRAFDSNGPEGIKVRGNAQHVFEKYQQLARDAGAAGDRVLAENYLQHAEHYFRLLRAIQPQRPPSEILGRDQFASGFDIDFEDESGAQAQPEVTEDGEGGEDRQQQDARGGWQDRPREERRDRDDRQDRPQDRSRGDRDDRPRDRDRGRDRWRDRDDRPRDRDRDDRNRDRDERPRADRDDRRDRDDRPRDRDDRQDRPRGDRDERRDRDDRPPREDRYDRQERDPLPVVEPQASGGFGGEERASPVLRDAEGGESHAPAFLQSPTPRREDGEDGAPARRPRRRRTAAAPAADGGDEA